MSATRADAAGDEAAAAATATAAATAGGKKPQKECSNFESQTWRKNVCKNCFRMKSQHTSTGQQQQQQQQQQAGSGGVSESPPSTSFRKLPAAGSPRTSRKSALERTGSGKSLSSSPSGSRRTTPESKRKELRDESKLPVSRSRSASKESLRASSRGFTAGSGFDEKYVEDLENDLFDVEDKYETLCREKVQLETQLEERLGDIEDLEGELEECRAKVVQLEKRVGQLEQEIRTYRERLKLPESEQSQHSQEADSEPSESTAQELEDICQELMEENDQLKEEVDELQKELSEMHDSFHEEDSQANTVRELQRELDAANKSYRVIQFKLRKAERRFDQCEAERSDLEEKLRRFGERVLSGDESGQVQELEDELRMAKEVSVRLHDELQFIEEKRTRLDGENQKLKFELESSERERIRLENEIDRVRLQLNQVKSDAGLADQGPLQVVDKTSPRPRLGLVASRESSIEEDHLKRELTATRERETDLVEQLRFSKEEVKILKRKLQEAEEENDSLTSKLRKIATGGDSGRVRFSSDESVDIEFEDTQQPERQLPRTKSSVAAESTETQKLLTQIDSELEEMKRKVQAAAQLSSEDFSLQEKWIEASEAKKQLELKVTELKRRLADLEEANASLKVEVSRLDKQEQRNSAGQKKTVQQLENASKAELLREVGDLEDEVEELMLTIKKGDFKVETLEHKLKTADEDVQETRQTYEEDERFFIEQVEKLQKQNELLGDLLSLITLRRRYVYECESSAASSGSDQQQKTLPVNIDSKSEAADEVFTETQSEQDVHYWDNKFRERLHSLEILLTEERQRTRQFQQKLDSISEDQKREEKDSERFQSLIEDKDSQLKDYQSKLEQSRRMYDALKLLVDDTSDRSTTKTRIEDRSNSMNQHKSEAAEFKKRNEQLTAKLAKMEKDKANSDKNSHILNEELKLREEHIFEQDDVIRGLQRKLQEADREFERLKSELHQLKTQFSSVKEKNTESARLKEELHKYILTNSEKERQLAEVQDQLNEKKAELADTSEKLQSFQDAVRNRDDRIKEKDELICLINTRLANRERELSDLDSVLKQTNQKLASAEGELGSTRQHASEQEKEVKNLRCRLDELQAAAQRHNDELQKIRQSCEQQTQATVAGKEEAMKKCSDLRRERDQLRGQLELLRSHSIAPSDSAVDSSLPIDIQVRLKHLEQVEKIYLQLTHQQVTLKMQVDAYQREVEEFRELYYTCSERYRAERSDWLQQRETLQLQIVKNQQARDPDTHELRAQLIQKEKEILNLQQQMEKQQRDQEEETMKLQRQNLELKSKANAFVDERKVPKVLQRFAGSKKSPMVGGESAFDTERTEYQVRLAEQEKKMDKLRKEVRELTEKLEERQMEQLDSKGNEILRLSERLQQLQIAAAQAETHKNEAFASHSREESLQESLIRERKRWQTEKLGLQYTAEQFKVMLDQWLDRFMNAIEELEAMKLESGGDSSSSSSSKQEELRHTIQLIVGDICKYKSKLSNRERSPTRSAKTGPRSTLSSSSASEETTEAAASSAGRQPLASQSGLGQKPSLIFGGGLSNRSISMDWSSGKNLMRSESPFRSKRSASPDVSVKKVTNFPDPSPGFWIKPSSRTNSKESLVGSQSNLVRFSPQVADDSSQSASRTANAAARRRFYDAYDEKVYASSERLHRRPEMSHSVHEESPSSVSLSAAEQLSPKSHSLDVNLSDAKSNQKENSAAQQQAAASASKSSSSEKPPPAKAKSRNPFGVTLKTVKPESRSSSGSKVAVIKKLFPK